MPAVAHVVTSLGIGGQERVIVDLAARQRRQGMTVHAVTLSPLQAGMLDGELRARAVAVWQVAKRPGFDPGLAARLQVLFRRLGLSLVHTHNPMPLVYAAAAGKLAGARVVHTMHGEQRDGLRRQLLRRLGTCFVDRFVAVSQATADMARRRHECPASKLRVIRNGSDLSRFGRDERARTEVRAGLGIAADAVVIGTIGRLVPEKHQTLLLEACAPLLSPRVQLLVVGEGPARPELEARVRALPCPGAVHLTGRRSDVPALLAAMDVFALSSRSEGLPMVVIEAMASELPVVATAVGGIAEVVRDRESGLLVAPGDAPALRAALAALVEAPGLARRLAAAARREVHRAFDAERMSREYLSLYRDVLGE
jgi:sugar transferase (PEP-CTERM/EpsH1 system associated)